MDLKLDFEDVLIVPSVTRVDSRSKVDLVRTINGKWGASITGVPIIAANMDGVGVPSVANALAQHQIFTSLVKHLSSDEWQRSPRGYTFYTIGMCDDEMREAKAAYVLGKDKFGLVVDIANGHLSQFADFITYCRSIMPLAFIIAGNVVSPYQTKTLLNCGADLVKVGIGSGAACLTRRVAGVGYPQFSAVLECAEAAREVGGGIVSDGGCVYPGDVSKAFAAGADMVMLGTMFAGHEEGGQVDALGYATYYGMSSHAAQRTHKEEQKEYRASEGRVTRIPSKGSIHNTVRELLGGIRSTCTYIGAEKIEQLNEADFVRVNNTINRSLERYTLVDHV